MNSIYPTNVTSAHSNLYMILSSKCIKWEITIKETNTNVSNAPTQPQPWPKFTDTLHELTFFFKRKFTNYSACTVEEKSQLDKCYQVKSDTTAQCSTAKSAPKSFFSAEEINLKKAKEVELKFKKQALTVKLNTAKVQGKTNKLLREFLYLLLDPRLVPDEDDDFAFYPAKFSQFAREATFYLGRGTSLNRPYVHERKDGEVSVFLFIAWE